MREITKLQELKSFIINWNNKFIIDHWFRRKYNIAFNSLKHRESNLIDIKIEYEEETLMENYKEGVKNKEEDNEYYKTTGQFLKTSRTKKLSEAEIEAWYDSIDLKSLNKGQSGKS